MKNVTKKELIATVAQNTGVTQKQAGEVIEATLSQITEELAAGNKISLAGFGNFEVRERASREGRNPRTGEKMIIAASKTVGFSSLKALKEAVSKY